MPLRRILGQDMQHLSMNFSARSKGKTFQSVCAVSQGRGRWGALCSQHGSKDSFRWLLPNSPVSIIFHLSCLRIFFLPSSILKGRLWMGFIYHLSIHQNESISPWTAVRVQGICIIWLV